MSAFSAYSTSFSRLFHRHNSSKIIHSAETATCSLLQLPIEVLLQIYDLLDVVETLLLAKTSHPLRQLTIQQHHRHAFAEVRAADWRGYKRLLRKDKCYRFLKEQALGIIPPGSSVCGLCLTTHPDHWFTDEELRKGPFRRVCLARTIPIRVCEHKHMSYQDLEDMRADGGDLFDICSQHASRDGGSLSTIWLRSTYPIYKGLPASNQKSHEYFGPRLTLEYMFKDYIFDAPDLKDRPLGNWLLCPHWSLGEVVQALHPAAEKPCTWLLCEQCQSSFFRWDGRANPMLEVKRDLGRAGDVPDAAWASAIDLEPRRAKSRRGRRKAATFWKI